MNLRLETKHLTLVPLTREIMDNLDNLVSTDDIKLNPKWPTEDIMPVIPMHLQTIKNAPDEACWGIWLMIRKEDKLIVGDLGFKGKQNADDEVEIGYGVIEDQRRKGYCFQAAEALIDWAFSKQNVKKVKADCLKDNEGSIAVLKKLKMKLVKEDDKLYYWDKTK